MERTFFSVNGSPVFTVCTTNSERRKTRLAFHLPAIRSAHGRGPARRAHGRNRGLEFPWLERKDVIGTGCGALQRKMFFDEAVAQRDGQITAGCGTIITIRELSPVIE
jgi:hypothetical protein